MPFQDLGGTWKIRQLGCKDWLDATMPGSVFSALLELNKISDPFYRYNEQEAYKLSENDYEFAREFTVDESLMKNEYILLCCEGLDTVCEIKINNNSIAQTNNMHRKYEFEIKKFLNIGVNLVSIIFTSPLKYIKDMAGKSLSY